MGGLNQTSRQQRRLYVAGFPVEVTEEQVNRYLSRKIQALSGAQDPIIGVQISGDRNYAFVDMRNPEDATTLLGLDGVEWEDGRSTIRIRRPREYSEGGAEAADGPSVLATIAANVPETDKLAIVGLPPQLAEAHVSALVEPFGDLKSCLLLVNPATKASLGVAVFEYRDASLNSSVREALDGLMVGAHALALRPLMDIAEDEPELLAALSFFNLAPNAVPADPTSVVQLLNMVAEEDLRDDYDGLREDVEAAAAAFGTITQLVIPRPSPASMQTGVGKIFVEFSSAAEASAAIEGLGGRVYADRTVVAAFFPTERFKAGLF